MTKQTPSQRKALRSIAAKKGSLSPRDAPSDEHSTPGLIWLWKNGDHFVAYKHCFPTRMDCGDPCTIGEPWGFAYLHESRPGPKDADLEELISAMARARFFVHDLTPQKATGGEPRGKANPIQSLASKLNSENLKPRPAPPTFWHRLKSWLGI